MAHPAHMNTTVRFIDYFNRLLDCTEGASFNHGLESVVHCSP